MKQLLPPRGCYVANAYNFTSAAQFQKQNHTVVPIQSPLPPIHIYGALWGPRVPIYGALWDPRVPGLMDPGLRVPGLMDPGPRVPGLMDPGP